MIRPDDETNHAADASPRNIDKALARYHRRWLGRIDSEMQALLIDLLQRERRGEFDRPWAGGSGG